MFVQSYICLNEHIIRHRTHRKLLWGSFVHLMLTSVQSLIIYWTKAKVKGETSL